MASSKKTEKGGWLIKKGNYGSSLGFHNCRFSAEGISRIEQAFNTNQTLRTLRLSNCRLTDSSVDGICDLLRSNAVLQSVELYKSTFTDEGFRRILNGLTRNQSLTHFCMFNSGLTDTVSGAVENFLLWNSTLQILDLGYSEFRDGGMKEVLEGLAANHSLQELSLENSQLSDAVARVIKEFATNNSTLRVLKLDDPLRDQQAANVLRGLTDNVSLKEFRSEDYKHLKQKVGRGQPITTLISGMRDQDLDEIEHKVKELGLPQAKPVDDEREIPGAKAANLFSPSEVVPKVAYQAVPAGASRANISHDIPLWDKRHPNANKYLDEEPDLQKKVIEAAPRLKTLVRTTNLWSYLQRYHVMNDSDLDECQVGPPGQQVESLVKFLKQGEVWRTHAFFRSLAQIDQAGLIDLVLGTGHMAAYMENLQDM